MSELTTKLSSQCGITWYLNCVDCNTPLWQEYRNGKKVLKHSHGGVLVDGQPCPLNGKRFEVKPISFTEVVA